MNDYKQIFITVVKIIQALSLTIKPYKTHKIELLM